MQTPDQIWKLPGLHPCQRAYDSQSLIDCVRTRIFFNFYDLTISSKHHSTWLIGMRRLRLLGGFLPCLPCARVLHMPGLLASPGSPPQATFHSSLTPYEPVHLGDSGGCLLPGASLCPQCCEGARYRPSLLSGPRTSPLPELYVILTGRMGSGECYLWSAGS